MKKNTIYFLITIQLAILNINSAISSFQFKTENLRYRLGEESEFSSDQITKSKKRATIDGYLKLFLEKRYDPSEFEDIESIYYTNHYYFGERSVASKLIPEMEENINTDFIVNLNENKKSRYSETNEYKTFIKQKEVIENNLLITEQYLKSTAYAEQLFLQVKKIIMHKKISILFYKDLKNYIINKIKDNVRYNRKNPYTLNLIRDNFDFSQEHDQVNIINNILNELIPFHLDLHVNTPEHTGHILPKISNAPRLSSVIRLIDNTELKEFIKLVQQNSPRLQAINKLINMYQLNLEVMDKVTFGQWTQTVKEKEITSLDNTIQILGDIHFLDKLEKEYNIEKNNIISTSIKLVNEYNELFQEYNEEFIKYNKLSLRLNAYIDHYVSNNKCFLDDVFTHAYKSVHRSLAHLYAIKFNLEKNKYKREYFLTEPKIDKILELMSTSESILNRASCFEEEQVSKDKSLKNSKKLKIRSGNFKNINALKDFFIFIKQIEI